MKKPPLISIFLFVAWSASAQTVNITPVLHLHADKLSVHVSQLLYGLMTEEINYSYDGGLYAELIRNRVFKDDPENPTHWSIVQDGGAIGAISLDRDKPLNQALTTSLKLDISSASDNQRIGIANDGYWGIPLKPDASYRASFYARGGPDFTGPLTLSLESIDGGTVYARADVPKITADWQQYVVTLTTAKMTSSSATRFLISTKKKGSVWFNLVSLFPSTFNNRPNGNRVDLMQMLVDMKPAFLRLPGGNYLEGRTIADRFDWKKTIHDPSRRPGHKGPWGYQSSDGMGLLEFMEWCEDMHAQPVLAVFAGYALNGQHIAAGPELEPFVQDALDEIEYVTGDNTTKWGAQRVKDGHPEPFKLTCVEIGNEDGFDKSGSYDGRFAQFFDAIKAKYPALRIISTAGGKDSLGARQKVTLRKPDIIDEHYYRNAGEMEGDVHHYDDYDRTGPKIFVGEWATREGAPTTNLNAALGDAAWMTGMERNSDLVVISSYAPLFVNVNPGGMQWKSDLIGYDALNCYGSPSYYAQKMFNTYLGDRVVPIDVENLPTHEWQPPAPRNGQPPAPRQLPTLFFVATRDAGTGRIYLKVVNTAGNPQPVEIQINGVANVEADGVSVVLASAKPTDTNSISEPTKIVPVTSKAGGLGKSFLRTFAPYSINILQVEAR